MLNFQKDIIKETIPHSNITVTGSGLEIFGVIIAQLKLYDINNGITLVLNASDVQKDILKSYEFDNLRYKEINKAEKRKEYYLLGGIFICSHQTLLSDIINDVLDKTKISCIFVFNVEKLKLDEHVAFIIDIVKSQNENCVVRGFTEDIGLNLEETRTILQTNRMHFYPRFYKKIKEDLCGEIDMLTKNLIMPSEMEEAQILLIETIKLLVAELKKEDKYGIEIDYNNMLNEVDNIYKEASLLAEKYYYKGLVRRYVEDIKTIKFFLNVLFFDYQVFCKVYMIFWNEQVRLRDKSTWINLESAIMIMDKIGKKENDAKKPKIENDETDFTTALIENIKFMSFSEGKIKVLNDLIKKIDNALILVRSNFAKNMLEALYENEGGRIRVFTHSEYQLSSLKRNNVILFEFSLESIRKIEILDAIYKKFGESRIDNKKTNPIPAKIIDYATEKSTNEVSEITSDDFDDNYEFKGFNRVFIINYKNSIEEQGYLINLRSESELFKEKINRYSKLPLVFFDTSIVLDEADKTNYSIKIDFREMRCKLPYYLYRSKAEITICALDIGDYILGNVVIERKSIGDFINSINTGRLYTQTRNMVHFYKSVYILMEFVGRTCISDYVDNYIYQKLAIYLITFPNVKIIWSNSELMSIKSIKTIQQNHSDDKIEEGTDPILMEILLNLPGIDQYNYRRIIDNFDSLQDLLSSGEERICKHLGKSTGAGLFSFFNDKINRDT